MIEMSVMRKFLHILSAIIVATCCFSGVYSEDVIINSMEDFEEFAEILSYGGYDQDIHLTLNTDLDLADTSIVFPLGDPMDCNMFSGVFDGNGHSISNLVVNWGQASASFFLWFQRYNEELDH